MARTLKSLIIKSLKGSSQAFVSPGELYQLAVAQGYNGRQEKLLFRAEDMVDRGAIDGAIRGRAQHMWFRYDDRSHDGGSF